MPSTWQTLFNVWILLNLWVHNPQIDAMLECFLFPYMGGRRWLSFHFWCPLENQLLCLQPSRIFSVVLILVWSYIRSKRQSPCHPEIYYLLYCQLHSDMFYFQSLWCTKICWWNTGFKRKIIVLPPLPFPNIQSLLWGFSTHGQLGREYQGLWLRHGLLVCTVARIIGVCVWRRKQLWWLCHWADTKGKAQANHVTHEPWGMTGLGALWAWGST